MHVFQRSFFSFAFVAFQVSNPSASFEGITALHNAICAGHFDIVRHLVEIGCDVNAPDNDGWSVFPISRPYFKLFSNSWLENVLSFFGLNRGIVA